jgi:hypothetical protein
VLWQYDTGGRGEVLLPVLSLDELQQENYDPRYLIDSTGNYLALNRFEGGSKALVIWSISPFKILKEVPHAVIFDGVEPWIQTWSANSLWLTRDEGALIFEFAKINLTTNEISHFPLPDGSMGGDAFNFETGWITYNPYSFWSGETISTKEEQLKRLKEGNVSELHVYNLFTMEDRLIESTKEDPLWYFKPRWISDNELQYVLPNGDQKIYSVGTGEYKLIK